jgi:glycosyltransferase involved in cell wall biosynthesis
LDISNKEGVTIVICFYNAEQRILPTLQHIMNQKGRTNSNTELVLVNNASTDDTYRIIEETMREFILFPWKIVQEKTPGLANARLCGLKNTSFDIVLYCDDDNWLDFDYVSKAELILRNNSNIGILGGLGRPVSSIQIPDWFENVQNYYAVGPQMPTSGRVIGTRNVVYGAGMLIRKSVFEKLISEGFVFQSLGRTKSNLNAGEDSELCLAVQIMGYPIQYEESLTFSHFIEPRRLTETYFQKMKNGISTSGFYSKFYLDFFKGKNNVEIPSHFWLKELIYTFRNIFNSLLRLNFNVKRELSLILFLIKERSKYDLSVTNILVLCRKLSKK